MKFIRLILLLNGLLFLPKVTAQELSIENIKDKLANCCKTGYTYEFRINNETDEPLLLGGGTVVPKSYSLKSYCPPVVNQIGTTCASYASAYYGMTIYSRIKTGRLDYPVFNPMNLHQRIMAFYDVCLDDSDPKIGLSSYQPFAFLSKFGCDTLSKEQSIQPICPENPNILGNVLLDSWKALNNTKAKISGIKKELAAGNPLYLAIHMNDFSFSKYHRGVKFFAIFTKSSPEKLDQFLEAYAPILGMAKDKLKFELKTLCSPSNTNKVDSTLEIEFCWAGSYPSEKDDSHAMCIVGFDDTKFGGAFEIANSWGDDWANGGFIWIRYDDLYNMYPTFTKIGN
jgi:hypothetical protein